MIEDKEINESQQEFRNRLRIKKLEIEAKRNKILDELVQKMSDFITEFRGKRF